MKARLTALVALLLLGASAYAQGIIATVDRELGLPYKQPGFFD